MLILDHLLDLPAGLGAGWEEEVDDDEEVDEADDMNDVSEDEELEPCL